MRKFEVCIKGRNFLVKEDGKTKKRSFLAARSIEGATMSDATKEAMASLKAELQGRVLNKEEDPPSASVEEIEEVYYFQESMVVGSKHVPMTGILWEDDKELPKEIAAPISTWKGGWSSFTESVKTGDLHIHTMLIHFTNALYPVSILFMILFFIFGKSSFDTAHFYTLLLATISAPPSYLAGLFEWKRRHQGAMIPIFAAKIRYGMLVFAIGAVACVWHLLSPAVLSGGGIQSVLYLLLNLSVIAPILYLGHLGGMIVYEGVE